MSTGAHADGAPVALSPPPPAAGGIPAVVDHGENGLLVPFGDVPALANAMQRLLADASLRGALGANGQQKVRRDYTWPAVASRVLSLYQEVDA